MNYEKRYGLISGVSFPKFKSYEAYQASVDEYKSKSTDEIFEFVKNQLALGNKILQNLLNTDEKYRNNKVYQKEELEKIIKISVMNSLLISQIKMA